MLSIASRYDKMVLKKSGGASFAIVMQTDKEDEIWTEEAGVNGKHCIFCQQTTQNLLVIAVNIKEPLEAKPRMRSNAFINSYRGLDSATL